MSEIVLNCRNLACPQPVIRTKKLVESSAPESFVVIVDNEPALENVSRFLGSQGYAAAHIVEDGLWRITGTRLAARTPPAQSGVSHRQKPAGAAEEMKTLVMIIAPVFGSGDDMLGGKLMKNFLTTLPELGDTLSRIVLLNGGVTLAAEGSPVLAELQALEKGGVTILVCGTCLEHFGLLAKKAVGQTTNMLDVVTSMQLADKIIRI
jgi:selenium metabolism protein YedF